MDAMCASEYWDNEAAEFHEALARERIAADVAELVLRHRRETEVTLLDDAALWGSPITDERYVITSRR